jgi:hypothetical protein
MGTEQTKQSYEISHEIGHEEEDIAYSMRDEAEFLRSWINDCLLRQYIRKSGNDRLDANTRKLIKVTAYNEYIRLSQKLHKDLKMIAQALLSEIKNK